jgi:starvation-inducible DNA-binding protein
MPQTNETVAEQLKTYLADTYLLLAKTQACHWNARGPNFIGIHKLTEEQYNELFAAIDELAERVRALDTDAPFSLAEMLRLATLEEATQVHGLDDAIRMLVTDNKAMSERARDLALDADEQDDLVTHDMLVARIEVHDKAAWLLRSNLA